MFSYLAASSHPLWLLQRCPLPQTPSLRSSSRIPRPPPLLPPSALPALCSTPPLAIVTAAAILLSPVPPVYYRLAIIRWAISLPNWKSCNKISQLLRSFLRVINRLPPRVQEESSVLFPASSIESLFINGLAILWQQETAFFTRRRLNRRQVFLSRRPVSPSRRPVSPSRRPVSPSRRPVSPSRRPISPSRRPVCLCRRLVFLSRPAVSFSRQQVFPSTRQVIHSFQVTSITPAFPIISMGQQQMGFCR